MPQQPNLDPNWTRKRQAKEEDRSLRFIAVASVVTVLVGALVARTHFQAEAEAREATAHAETQATAERVRRLEREATVREATERAAAQGALGWNPSTNQRLVDSNAVSSFNGDQIRQCAYAGSVTYQRAPCNSPWVEVQGEFSSRRRRVEEDQWVREQAEARLRAEQQRYAAAAGQGDVTYWQTPSPSQSSAQSQCAMAKADRDNAYRLAGNNRGFDFIRRWDDIVYEACKGT